MNDSILHNAFVLNNIDECVDLCNVESCSASLRNCIRASPDQRLFSMICDQKAYIFSLNQLIEFKLKQKNDKSKMNLVFKKRKNIEFCFFNRY